MRPAIVGVLAALGMTLTSTVVWSMTTPSDASASDGRDIVALPKLLGGDGKAQDDTPAAPPKLVDKSTFVSGKTLMLEGRLGHGRMLADARSETFLFVDVRSELDQLAKLAKQTSAQPLNLAIVIDHSGSMKGQRERNAQDAAAGMIRRLRDGDTVSVVSYSERAEIIVPVTTINSATRERLVLDMINRVGDRPSGNTCVSCGIQAGLQTFTGRRRGIDRMLLLSDGEANRGIQDEAGMRVLARQVRNRGATISSIGVDVDYNEALMSAIAREANGRHYFSETGDNLEDIFDQELESLVTSIARDAKLVVELAPGVRAAQIFDRSYQQVDRQIIVPMGTFAAGEEKTFLMRLDVPPSPAGERPIASVTFTYDDLTGASVSAGECFGELASNMTATPSEVAPLDAIVLSRLTRSETAAALAEANVLFAAERTNEAQALIDNHLQNIRQRRKAASAAVAAGGVVDPFDRDLDGDFDNQAGILNDANSEFEAAEAAPMPASASRTGKTAVKKNQTQADALSL